MTTVTGKKIREVGRQVILDHPDGIRYSELVSQILQVLPDANSKYVQSQVANALIPSFSTELCKPSRGLFKPLSGDSKPVTVAPATTEGFQKEDDVYEPFAEWLKNDLEEATEAVALGGASFKTKWGTPDVVGVYRPLASQLIKFSPEIVAAEIKIDSNQTVVAFGQSIAYRLFSARTYVVMPLAMGKEDQARLESLCLLFGVGLVLFDADHAKDPGFTIRVRAQRFFPDIFYVNEFASRLNALDSAKFQTLFG